MDKPLPPIDMLLEMDPASFAAALDGQPEHVKSEVRSALAERLDALDQAAWGNSRKLRGHLRQFEGAKFDYGRLEQTQQWLATQFHETFATIYADPAAAAAKCWAYEQQYGPAQTGRMLKTAPALFGDLKGWSLLGFKSTARSHALEHAAKFDFAAYRLVFSLASETGKSLIDALKDTAHVANA